MYNVVALSQYINIDINLDVNLLGEMFSADLLDAPIAIIVVIYMLYTHDQLV